MEMHFEATPEWTLTDENLIIERSKKRIIPLSAIKVVEHRPLKNGKASFFQSSGTIKIKYDPQNGSLVDALEYLSYYPSQNEDGIKAAEVLSNFVRNAKFHKEMEKKKEFRKRCSTCGKIFCYTLEDLEKNNQHIKNSMLSSIGGIAGALSGNYAAGATSNQAANDEINRIIDYSKCPSCGSKNLIDVSDQDFSEVSIQQNDANMSPIQSSADELKKYKELLDMGAITQEEFDAKKKQLLGL